MVRQILHQFIDSIEDKKAEAIFTIFEDEINIGQHRKKLIEAERQNYLHKKGNSYSWDAVKQMAINKDQRHAI